MANLGGIVVVLRKAERGCETPEVIHLEVRKLIVGRCKVDENLEHLEAALAIGQLAQIAHPTLVAAADDRRDIALEKRCDHLDIPVIEHMHARELLANLLLLGVGEDLIGIGDAGEQASDRRDDALLVFGAIGQALFDDAPEWMLVGGGWLVVENRLQRVQNRSHAANIAQNLPVHLLPTNRPEKMLARARRDSRSAYGSARLKDRQCSPRARR